MAKISRSRNGCITCKQRRRKCDETKPCCLRCLKSGRQCGGYGVQLIFDVDDSRNEGKQFSLNSKGERKYGFRGRPRKDTLSKSCKIGKPEKRQGVPVKFEESQLVGGIVGMCKTGSAESVSACSVGSAVSAVPMDLISPTSGTSSFSSLDEEGKVERGIQDSATPITSSVRRSDIDIANPFQFEDALYDGLDYLLSNSEQLGVFDGQELLSPVSRRAQIEAQNGLEWPQSFLQLIKSPGMGDLNERLVPPKVEAYSSVGEQRMLSSEPTTSEDNFILRHFFEKVVYLLDAHPKSPWPELMIQFCSFELARSCFLSLSSIHLFVNNGGKEFYKKGVIHINNTMEYLMKYVKKRDDGKDSKAAEQSTALLKVLQARERDDPIAESSDKKLDSAIAVERIMNNLRYESEKRKRSNFFVILLLLYVHLLFAILESGRSALSRLFLRLFASIAADTTFESFLRHIDQSQTLICVLSWFDTITALVSPDFRLPFSRPEWYGTRDDNISTARMNGCPGEIFEVLSEICKLRNRLGGNWNVRKCAMDELECKAIFDKLKGSLIDYREYVPLMLENSFPYEERLKGAQCWSLAAYVKLLEVCQIGEDYKETIESVTLEFLSVYETLDSQSPIVTQMVWPVLEIAIHCRTEKTKIRVMELLETLYDTVKMGTIQTMIRVTKESWSTGKDLDQILSGREWLGAGIDFIPC
ncbi:DEKNAAC100146 [Brettanomyces naardenensis]|uniref:DEKNAAC100146 n=1 Tax=Brettanomyces naardenensis TaxID=13370 RepID=A0A448YFH5_BRENA|nr:DEKNAAC100146 [Brettanomyces naardenensis]